MSAGTSEHFTFGNEWNGRLWFYGNGGAAGSCNPGGVLWAASRGMVGVHTDMGTGNPPETLSMETIIDFGHRATHLTLLEAKRLVRETYGREPDKCYFEGQSTGGGQGIHAAIRYPDDSRTGERIRSSLCDFLIIAALKAGVV